MYAWEVGIFWDQVPYEPEQFRLSHSNKKFIGEPIEKVREKLGESDGGYYNYDSNLSYKVYENEKTAWDLVFIADHQTGKIHNILVHRSRGGTTRVCPQFD